MYKKQHKKYIVADSDLLRHLVCTDLVLHNKSTEGLPIASYPLEKYKKVDERLLRLVKADVFRLQITNTVYDENKYSSRMTNFMQQYCYFPKNRDSEDKLELIEKLANIYCHDYITKDGNTIPAPMKTTVDEETGEIRPTKDCYIMAEATVENCCVLTYNVYDFLRNTDLPYRNWMRQHDIMLINKDYLNQDLVPIPYHPTEFLKKLLEKYSEVNIPTTLEKSTIHCAIEFAR